jgi:hypothetical protein
MITIWVELEDRSVARSLFRWGPKGEPNALFVAESKVTDFEAETLL